MGGNALVSGTNPNIQLNSGSALTVTNTDTFYSVANDASQALDPRCYAVTYSITSSFTFASGVYLEPFDTNVSPVATTDGQGAFPPTDIAVGDLIVYSVSEGAYLFTIQATITDIISDSNKTSDVSFNINVINCPTYIGDESYVWSFVDSPKS